MEEALRLIIARSGNAASEAIQCLAALRANSPILQQRYARVLQVAFSDPSAAEFTAADREILAAALDMSWSNKRDGSLQVRMSQAELAEIKRLADEAGMTVSDYARGRLLA